MTLKRGQPRANYFEFVGEARAANRPKLADVCHTNTESVPKISIDDFTDSALAQ